MDDLKALVETVQGVAIIILIGCGIVLLLGMPSRNRP